jgi:hypothetical protein
VKILVACLSRQYVAEQEVAFVRVVRAGQLLSSWSFVAQMPATSAPLYTMDVESGTLNRPVVLSCDSASQHSNPLSTAFQYPSIFTRMLFSFVQNPFFAGVSANLVTKVANGRPVGRPLVSTVALLGLAQCLVGQLTAPRRAVWIETWYEQYETSRRRLSRETETIRIDLEGAVFKYEL